MEANSNNDPTSIEDGTTVTTGVFSPVSASTPQSQVHNPTSGGRRMSAVPVSTVNPPAPAVRTGEEGPHAEELALFTSLTNFRTHSGRLAAAVPLWSPHSLQQAQAAQTYCAGVTAGMLQAYAEGQPLRRGEHLMSAVTAPGGPLAAILGSTAWNRGPQRLHWLFAGSRHPPAAAEHGECSSTPRPTRWLDHLQADATAPEIFSAVLEETDVSECEEYMDDYPGVRKIGRWICGRKGRARLKRYIDDCSNTGEPGGWEMLTAWQTTQDLQNENLRLCANVTTICEVPRSRVHKELAEALVPRLRVLLQNLPFSPSLRDLDSVVDAHSAAASKRLEGMSEALRRYRLLCFRTFQRLTVPPLWPAIEEILSHAPDVFDIARDESDVAARKPSDAPVVDGPAGLAQLSPFSMLADAETTPGAVDFLSTVKSPRILRGLAVHDSPLWYIKLSLLFDSAVRRVDILLEPLSGDLLPPHDPELESILETIVAVVKDHPGVYVSVMDALLEKAAQSAGVVSAFCHLAVPCSTVGFGKGKGIASTPPEDHTSLSHEHEASVPVCPYCGIVPLSDVVREEGDALRSTAAVGLSPSWSFGLSVLRLMIPIRVYEAGLLKITGAIDPCWPLMRHLMAGNPTRVLEKLFAEEVAATGAELKPSSAGLEGSPAPTSAEGSPVLSFSAVLAPVNRAALAATPQRLLHTALLLGQPGLLVKAAVGALLAGRDAFQSLGSLQPVKTLLRSIAMGASAQHLLRTLYFSTPRQLLHLVCAASRDCSPIAQHSRLSGRRHSRTSPAPTAPPTKRTRRHSVGAKTEEPLNLPPKGAPSGSRQLLLMHLASSMLNGGQVAADLPKWLEPCDDSTAATSATDVRSYHVEDQYLRYLFSEFRDDDATLTNTKMRMLHTLAKKFLSPHSEGGSTKQRENTRRRGQVEEVPLLVLRICIIGIISLANQTMISMVPNTREAESLLCYAMLEIGSASMFPRGDAIFQLAMKTLTAVVRAFPGFSGSPQSPPRGHPQSVWWAVPLVLKSPLLSNLKLEELPVRTASIIWSRVPFGPEDRSKRKASWLRFLKRICVPDTEKPSPRKDKSLMLWSYFSKERKLLVSKWQAELFSGLGED